MHDHSRERGQSLPLVAASIMGLMCVAALAIDVGNWRYQQRLEQTAADSAALAGATELSYSTSLSSITSSAQTDAASNGFTNGSSGTTVTVNNPPQAGAYAGNTSAVEVIVSKPQPMHFSLFGGTTNVSARSVAMLTSANRNCIYALDSSSSAITLDGGTIDAPKCGIISNGGLLFNGSGTVDAASIGYAGSSATLNNTSFPGAQPKRAIAAADPCPTVSGCSYLTATPPTSGACMSQTTFNSTSTITISPGKYCQQVLTEGGGAVVFSPGVYDFQAGFTNNNAPSMSGTGVTFYVQGGAFIVGSKTNVNLSAPTSGSTAGVLVYQPASNTSQFTLNGSSGGNWGGMIYLPGTTLIVDGGSITSSLLIVANDLLFNSTTNINVPTATLTGYSGHAVLAE
jgi:hypothetical protein